MVERELEPYQREDGPRILIKGPDVLLPPQCTSILAMTLHELATNAVKYGALSASAGQLGVSWRTARGNRLLLTWEERGAGVPLKRNNGFGMQLIDKGIRHNLGGETKVDFRATGLYVELNVPLEPARDTRPKIVAGAGRVRSSLLQRADRFVGVAQALGEIARQIGEDRDHDVGVRGREFLQLFDRQPVADHLLVGDHVGRAGAAVEQRHLAEGEPGTQRRHAPFPFSRLSRHPDLHAHASRARARRRASPGRPRG